MDESFLLLTLGLHHVVQDDQTNSSIRSFANLKQNAKRFFNNNATHRTMQSSRLIIYVCSAFDGGRVEDFA